MTFCRIFADFAYLEFTQIREAVQEPLDQWPKDQINGVEEVPEKNHRQVALHEYFLMTLRCFLRFRCHGKPRTQ